MLEKLKQLDEGSLVEIEPEQRVVVVGDTHGDFNSSQKIIDEFLDDSTTLIFLGDYVDRGSASKRNVDFLLQQKLNNPAHVYLLQGNHEGYPWLKFNPVDFWKNLDKAEFKFYKEVFQELPLVATFKNVIALHGCLPDIESLDSVNEIKEGSENWRRITWGDFSERSFLQGIRPQFDQDYFERKMDDFNKNFLIRSHQPNCPSKMFNDHCYTIFTSSAYGGQKTIALIDTEKKIKKENITIKQF
ncbi:MAG: metallophosphoesterase family protein [Candidatus Paceibacterota bacterium]